MILSLPYSQLLQVSCSLHAPAHISCSRGLLLEPSRRGLISDSLTRIHEHLMNNFFPNHPPTFQHSARSGTRRAGGELRERMEEFTVEEVTGFQIEIIRASGVKTGVSKGGCSTPETSTSSSPPATIFPTRSRGPRLCSMVLQQGIRSSEQTDRVSACSPHPEEDPGTVHHRKLRCGEQCLCTGRCRGRQDPKRRS